ncbi:hypothetical protein [Corallococcus terminator]|uniref:hypothetical protein n=1 Tax=Corallococcus terminator TaxID=2316733 RepID=UPI0011C3D612|nr:hypothetical protein [Corallococcus terminator]
MTSTSHRQVGVPSPDEPPLPLSDRALMKSWPSEWNPSSAPGAPSTARVEKTWMECGVVAKHLGDGRDVPVQRRHVLDEAALEVEVDVAHAVVRHHDNCLAILWRE